jgi:hypothetical protein
MAFIGPELPDIIRGFFKRHPLRIETLATITAQMELPALIGEARAAEFLALSQREALRMSEWFARFRDESAWPTDRTAPQAFYVDMGETIPEESGTDDCDNCLELYLMQVPLSESDDSGLFSETRRILPLDRDRYDTDAIRKCRMLVEPRKVIEARGDELGELHYTWPCILTGLAVGEVFARDPEAFFFSAEFFVNLWQDGIWRLPLRDGARA